MTTINLSLSVCYCHSLIIVFPCTSPSLALIARGSRSSYAALPLVNVVAAAATAALSLVLVPPTTAASATADFGG